jgi:glucokinase
MAAKELVLAGDIGGTKTNLALFSVRGDKLYAEATRTYASKQYSGLIPILKEFGEAERFEAACFGIAGPVIDGRVKTTNLPWIIDTEQLRRALKLQAVHLLNDLEASAFGLFTLENDDFVVLNEGEMRASGNKALIAAGTGLGQAILHDDGHHFRPIASEGGHGDFAARSEVEVELWRDLSARFGHVSYERVISGPGLVNIYRFLRDIRGMAEPPQLAERFASGDDAGAVISQAALAGEFEICVQALDLFVSAYGAEAGNLALRAKAVRGVYLGGGIAPKIAAKLQDGSFMRAMTEKGRYTEFVKAIPVQVVLNEHAALRGAGYYAAFLSGDET